VWPWQEVVQSLEEYSYALLLSLATAHGIPERAPNGLRLSRCAERAKRSEHSPSEAYVGLRLSLGVIPIL